MRYIGNKKRLLPFIQEVIDKHKIEGNTFVDLFAGSGAVGDYFKDQYQIIANDLQEYSFHINRAKLTFDKVPRFEKFNQKYHQDIWVWLNSDERENFEDLFAYKNYSPYGNRMYFTEDNAKKIDIIRQNIEQLWYEETINDNERSFLLASFVRSVLKVSNTTGTFEAYLKYWENRAKKDFQLTPIEFEEKPLQSSNNEIYSLDSIMLAKNIKSDITYIDPPYTTTQYSSAYHVIESLIIYNHAPLYGVTGRPKSRKSSLFSQKKNVKAAFESLLKNLNTNHVLISYNNKSLLSIDELKEICESHALNNSVFIEKTLYQEYKSVNSSKSSKQLFEYVIYFKMKEQVNYSPLNYQGNKTEIITDIKKHLPIKINTFFDVMGGAFNVGMNVKADKVVYNEKHPLIYELMQYIYKNHKKMPGLIEDVIHTYNLERGNKETFMRLREDYNKNRDPLLLYVLHIYSFQHMLRTNKKGNVNIPVGNSKWNNNLKNKLINFNVMSDQVIFQNECFTKIDLSFYKTDTFFYLDPPYLITNAQYNENRGFVNWSEEYEEKLLLFIRELNEKGYKFMLSNVLIHKNKVNHLLLREIEEQNYRVVEIAAKRKEVLIMNY